MSSDILNIIYNFIRRISRKIKISKVILFGSTARGDRLKQSDVDLIIVSNDFEGMPLNERFRILYIEWPPIIDVDIIPLTEKEFERALKRSIILQDAKRYWKEIKLNFNHVKVIEKSE